MLLASLKNYPNFGTCADLGHWPKSGVNPGDFLKKLKSHILGIHLEDIAAYNYPRLKGVPIGTGVLNFLAIFQELKGRVLLNDRFFNNSPTYAVAYCAIYRYK
ncbi:MAG: sugar phosphate isomerase/epimerase [Hymenobacter sp.]|uniref:Xylose isomerase-like TIM barrel domain-containing protein n=1 Tax=Spirosoma pollinicola TaxID=2057025 RepID=A0A2K8ZAN2_9BACT|nr:hypothetical protein CWM47_36915 [Spirosoma pollinicola]RZK34623.1 MAG: sugar phosphate isomerase/epimerase [Hymenobacter sp.]